MKKIETAPEKTSILQGLLQAGRQAYAKLSDQATKQGLQKRLWLFEPTNITTVWWFET